MYDIYMASELFERRTAMYEVIFLNERGERVRKTFDSPFICRKFVNKIKHSKKCKLIFVPGGIG